MNIVETAWNSLGPTERLTSLAMQKPPKKVAGLSEWGNKIVSLAKKACSELDTDELVWTITQFAPFRDPAMSLAYDKDARRLVWGTAVLYVKNKLNKKD